MTGRNEWPQERIEAMRKLWNDGHSAAVVGEALGMTRNAVLGKIHRLGWHRIGRAHPLVKRKPAAKAPRKPVARVKAAPRPPVPYQPLRQPVEPPVPVPLNIGLMDLAPRSCRWIEGSHEHPAIFCGATCDEGKSYCHAHNALVYRMVPQLSAAEQKSLWRRAA